LELTERTAGRPTAERLQREAMLDPLAAAYAAADEDFSDWWPDGAVPVYESKRWVLHADMRLAEARGVEEGDAESVESRDGMEAAEAVAPPPGDAVERREGVSGGERVGVPPVALLLRVAAAALIVAPPRPS